MIKIKVFTISSIVASKAIGEDEELGPIEDFIMQIGYENIKNIKIQSTTTGTGYYHIIYEDGLSYTPRTTPKKKGLFG